MLHALLHIYNAAPPEAKSAARAAVAFLAGAALAVLATACSPAYAGAGHGTIAPKPKGPVCEDTFSEAVAAPTEKRGFVSSEFSRCRHSGIGMVSGGMGLPVRMAARLRTCLQHPVHQMRVKTQTVALVTPEGAKTMTATPVASASARTPTANALNFEAVKTPTTSEAQAFALLQATSDATLAKMYLSRGNIPAARRKAVQLLKALQQLEVLA